MKCYVPTFLLFFLSSNGGSGLVWWAPLLIAPQLFRFSGKPLNLLAVLETPTFVPSHLKHHHAGTDSLSLKNI